MFVFLCLFVCLLMLQLRFEKFAYKAKANKLGLLSTLVGLIIKICKGLLLVTKQLKIKCELINLVRAFNISLHVLSICLMMTRV